MSDETHHIDDLFKDLNRMEGNPGEQDWQAILRKMEAEKDKALPPVKPVDELFGQGFDGFERPVSEMDWGAIQNKMTSGRKRRRIILFLWLLPLLLITGFTTWAIFSQQKHKELVNHQAVNTPAPGTNKQQQADDKPGNATAAESNARVVPETVNPIQPGKTATQQHNTQAEGVRAEKQIPYSDLITHKLYSGDKAGRYKGRNDQIRSKIRNPDGEGWTIYPPLSAINKPLTTDNEALAEPEPEIVEPAFKDEPVPAVASVPKSADINNIADTSAKNEKQDDPKKDPVQQRGKWRLLLNTGVTANSSVLDAENIRFQEIRNTQDKAAWLMNFGMNADYKISSNWRLGSGVHYTQTGYNASYDYHRTIYDSFPHLGPGGNILGWFRLNYRDTVQKSSEHLVRRSISIPLTAQYRFAASNKLDVVLGMAGTVNIFAGARGNTIIPYGSLDMKPVSEIEDRFRSVTMSMMLNAGMEYHLNNTWSLGAGLSTSRHLQNIYRKAYPVKEQPWNWGGNVSLIFHLPDRNIAKATLPAKPKL